MSFFPGTQEIVRNSRSKRAIRVRATEVLLYRGHASLKTLNQMELWCIMHLKWAGYLYISSTGGNNLAIYNHTIIDHLTLLAYIA